MSLISDLVSGGLSGIISPITNTVTAIFTKKEDVSLEKFKVDGQVDRNLIDAHTALGVAKINLLKNQWIIGLQIFLALPVGIFFWKCVVWDKVLAWGSTDALGGDIQTWALMIMSFLFAHSVLDAWGRKT